MVQPGRSAHYRAQRGQVAGEHAVRARLHEHVAERGGLDRPGEDRRRAASAVSWQSRAFCEPPPTRWTTSIGRPESRSRIVERGGEGDREAVEDAAHDDLAGPGSLGPTALAIRCGMSPGGGTPGRSGRRRGAARGQRRRGEQYSPRSTPSPRRFHARIDSGSSHRPMTLRRKRIVPSTPPSLVKLAARLSSVSTGSVELDARPETRCRRRCRRSAGCRPGRRRRPRRCRASRPW